MSVNLIGFWRGLGNFSGWAAGVVAVGNITWACCDSTGLVFAPFLDVGCGRSLLLTTFKFEGLSSALPKPAGVGVGELLQLPNALLLLDN
ncbi:hypothetical protein Nepgr_004033 [Nepenthes gracilis]|uniref:Uncharacterized protein n=1 Tax=Nepenthes gracilis TaxID=150966 RepID=A0AAD3S0P7_NEPGR|nr:hypothetical protein Nepgr_004033 [Nepenthes gracilis]